MCATFALLVQVWTCAVYVTQYQFGLQTSLTLLLIFMDFGYKTGLCVCYIPMDGLIQTSAYLCHFIIAMATKIKGGMSRPRNFDFLFSVCSAVI